MTTSVFPETEKFCVGFLVCAARVLGAPTPRIGRDFEFYLRKATSLKSLYLFLTPQILPCLSFDGDLIVAPKEGGTGLAVPTWHVNCHANLFLGFSPKTADIT